MSVLIAKGLTKIITNSTNSRMLIVYIRLYPFIIGYKRINES